MPSPASPLVATPHLACAYSLGCKGQGGTREALPKGPRATGQNATRISAGHRNPRYARGGHAGLRTCRNPHKPQAEKQALHDHAGHRMGSQRGRGRREATGNGRRGGPGLHGACAHAIMPGTAASVSSSASTQAAGPACKASSRAVHRHAITLGRRRSPNETDLGPAMWPFRAATQGRCCGLPELHRSRF